jgi:hypothetical protein
MIVVADSTPLNYLVLSQIELFPALYQSVLIPQEFIRKHRPKARPRSVTGRPTFPHGVKCARLPQIPMLL